MIPKKPYDVNRGRFYPEDMPDPEDIKELSTPGVPLSGFMVIRADADELRLIQQAPALLHEAKEALEIAEALIYDEFIGTKKYAAHMTSLEPLRRIIAEIEGENPNQ